MASNFARLLALWIVELMTVWPEYPLAYFARVGEGSRPMTSYFWEKYLRSRPEPQPRSRILELEVRYFSKRA